MPAENHIKRGMELALLYRNGDLSAALLSQQHPDEHADVIEVASITAHAIALVKRIVALRHKEHYDSLIAVLRSYGYDPIAHYLEKQYPFPKLH